jgi:hypothetical protein
MLGCPLGALRDGMEGFTKKGGKKDEVLVKATRGV